SQSGVTSRAAHNIRHPRDHRCRRIGELWVQHSGCVAPSRRLRRADAQGRQTGRPSSGAGDQARARRQWADRAHTWYHPATLAARDRRQGYRVIRRREFITLLSGTAASWPITAQAQQAGLPVVGFLSSRMASESVAVVAAFHQGLKEIGYVEGQNVSIEY